MNEGIISCTIARPSNGIAEEKNYHFQAKRGDIEDYKKINMNELDKFFRHQPVAVVRITKEVKALKKKRLSSLINNQTFENGSKKHWKNFDAFGEEERGSGGDS